MGWRLSVFQLESWPLGAGHLGHKSGMARPRDSKTRELAWIESGDFRPTCPCCWPVKRAHCGPQCPETAGERRVSAETYDWPGTQCSWRHCNENMRPLSASTRCRRRSCLDERWTRALHSYTALPESIPTTLRKHVAWTSGVIEGKLLASHTISWKISSLITKLQVT